MDCGRFLPESPLRMHDAGARCRKFDTIDLTRRVAADIADAGRLAGRSCAEFEHDARGDIAGSAAHRFIVEVERIVLQADCRRKRLIAQRAGDHRLDRVRHPDRKPLSHLTGPPFLLAAGFRQCFVIVADQVRRQGADIVGQVDILGEPFDDPIGFRKRGAALEDEMLAKPGRKERLQRPDDPDILFEQMKGPSGAFGCHSQGFAPVIL